jgi:hypothetical protein
MDVWRFFVAEGISIKKTSTPPSNNGLTSPWRASPGKRINPRSMARLAFTPAFAGCSNLVYAQPGNAARA